MDGMFLDLLLERDLVEIVLPVVLVALVALVDEVDIPPTRDDPGRIERRRPHC